MTLPGRESTTPRPASADPPPPDSPPVDIALDSPPVNTAPVDVASDSPPVDTASADAPAGGDQGIGGWRGGAGPEPGGHASGGSAPGGAGGRSDGTAAGAAIGWPSGADAAERRSRASQSFWTLVVGVPAIFSVLRLGVEAGGELQTTLLLVANVNPVNLAAALVTTAARLVSAGLVAVFAIGAVLLASAEAAPTHRIGRHPPLFARWRAITPPWVVIASFAVALATWPILYLPLLLPAFTAAFQLGPARLDERRIPRLLLLAALLAGYAVLMLPTLSDAWQQREAFAVLVIAAPPLLALLVPGPVPVAVARPLAMTVQLAVLAMLCWAALPVITTPVLPLTVTTIRADGDGGGTGSPGDPGTGPAAPGAVDGGVERIRGHVITTDDVSMVILQERGGVRYVPTGQVEEQVLCPTEEELPRYRLRIHGFHVEDSLLEGMGRRVRPVNRIDAECRTATTVP
ncbi:hypothetical protein [Plantactinospora endophytica]|uniref:Uncharacterized protein n=1 Tax=Plantactinospora endophytica TaxID=673535 RepID=A0ABQ4DRX0_9ACTN|nr:hypothetical protein [Plantactinospora endophytica]GIG85185.1 hypothetical protein Pen02_01210 [Plantactinospora endophytica]